MAQEKCLDGLMTKVFINLVGDFRKTLGNEYASTQLSLLKTGGIRALREFKYPGRARVSPALFKREYQLEAFFKRYRFENDVFTDKELEEAAVKKFMETQIRLDKQCTETPVINMVLRKARSIAKSILGDYDEAEHRNLCRFGKRACVGTTANRAYLDEKLKNLTGSHEHIRWFKNHLSTDDILRGAIREVSGKRRPFYILCETLTMSFVPKTYKALRGICPDTLLGSFYTAGLGRVIQDRLAKRGLDIRTLQKAHGVLARRSSITRFLVTADLSAASDSLTSWLLRRVLPLPWYRAVMFGRIPHVLVGGQRIRMNTVLTMGLGHTFPLQTLIFYCLLQAIKELAVVPGKVSVYGDDLIYPRRIHNYVKVIFPKMNLILNEDKTYVKDNFRESCGSDFYHGCDVRPFCLDAEHHHSSGTEYEKMLYKLHNGLLRRWRKDEIPNTIEWITSQLILDCDRILLVPPTFPDYSGCWVDEFVHGYFHESLTPCEPYQTMYFHSLGEVSSRREVPSQMIYYWEALRCANTVEEHDPWAHIDDLPVLKWNRKRVRRNGSFEVILVPTVAEKQSCKTSNQRTSLALYSALSHSSVQSPKCTPRTEYGAGRPALNPVRWARRVGWRGWPLT